MNKYQIEELVAGLVEELVKGTDYELVAVEYVRERDWYLRVLIDKPGGIFLDDCSAISSKLSPLLDETLHISSNYFLEVSSPGLDRPLRTVRDFERNVGKKIDVEFNDPKDGKKFVTAVLSACAENCISVDFEGVRSEYDIAKIASVKLHIEF